MPLKPISYPKYALKMMLISSRNTGTGNVIAKQELQDKRNQYKNQVMVIAFLLCLPLLEDGVSLL